MSIIFGFWVLVNSWGRTSARGALTMMSCPCIGQCHGCGVLWVAGVGEKDIFEISCVTLKIGPIALKLDDN